MFGSTHIESLSSQDFWLSFLMGWSLVALVIGAVLMLVINLLQNPPWPRSEDTPPPSEE